MKKTIASLQASPTAILTRLFSRFVRSSFPFPSPSDACHAGYVDIRPNYSPTFRVSLHVSQLQIKTVNTLCVFKYIHQPVTRLTLSTMHVEMCCCKHTFSTVSAVLVESWNHEELCHVGWTPIALCELMSRERDIQNDFAVVKSILM